MPPRSGGGRFVVIEGTAGIGKTRLLAEGRAIAGSAGMRVLAARGGELEGEFAYGIVRQLFEPLLAVVSPDLRAELLSGPAALIASLLGASQPAGSRDAAAEGSFAIVHGLYWLAANVALQRPTLLAIDDLHWADTPSLRWLLYLTRRLEGVPLLVVAGTRPPEGEGHDPTLVAELIADPEVAAIRPEPLGRASIAVLARELHGLEPDEAFCAALQMATGGNPLFVGAVLDAVARGGNQPHRRARGGSAGNRRAGRFSRGRASPRSAAAGGAGPAPRGLGPGRRGRAASRGGARRRGSR
jgi:AAA ATPase domain